MIEKAVRVEAELMAELHATPQAASVHKRLGRLARLGDD